MGWGHDSFWALSSGFEHGVTKAVLSHAGFATAGVWTMHTRALLPGAAL